MHLRFAYNPEVEEAYTRALPALVRTFVGILFIKANMCACLESVYVQLEAVLIECKRTIEREVLDCTPDSKRRVLWLNKRDNIVNLIQTLGDTDVLDFTNRFAIERLTFAEEASDEATSPGVQPHVSNGGTRR